MLPKVTCDRRTAAISATRAPVLYMASRSAWSRRPIRCSRSGAASRASISCRVGFGDPPGSWSSRLMGMASTWLIRER